MNNWIELKQWIKAELDDTPEVCDEAADSYNAALSSVMDKIKELEKEITFLAYTDEDGYELIRDKSQEGVMVWTHNQENNFVLLKVKKSAVIYQDEETNSFDCDPNGIEIVEKIK